MKCHLEQKEKELIREINNKLLGQTVSIQHIKSEIRKITGLKKCEVYINNLNDIRYDYILSYKDSGVEIEIGLDTIIINDEQYKINNIFWNEF